MRRKFLSFLCLSLLSGSAVGALPVHTWHTVSTSQGTWDARLQMINEAGSFVERDGSSIAQFAVTPNSPKEYGFVLSPDNDFNVAYTLTLTERTSGKAQFFSKACVYVITASEPKRPDIRASSFNGATCEWKIVPGVGENYSVF